MTSTRRLAKTRSIGTVQFAMGLLFLCTALLLPSRAAITDRVITDIHTGLAIDGYDPVAYFVDAEAKLGRPQFEYRYKGVIWRFTNEGNRAAFKQNTDIYVPRFGGYDAVAMSRGIAVAGNPTLWLIAGDRLYLFYSAEARDSFENNMAGFVGSAEANWQQVLQGLAP
jgi:YHS domain-containing protein